jgi:hypothetical protein
MSKILKRKIISDLLQSLNAAYNALKTRPWFVFVILIFFLFWWKIGFWFPILNDDLPGSKLPTNESKFIWDKGEFGIKCIDGGVSKTRMVQGDLVRCKISFYNESIDYGAINGTKIFVGSDPESYERISNEDYNINSRWYGANITYNDLSRDANGVYTYFWIKVPPVHIFMFLIQTPSPDYPYITQEHKFYQKTTITLEEFNTSVQLLLSLLAIFGGAYYLKELWKK